MNNTETTCPLQTPAEGSAGPKVGYPSYLYLLQRKLITFVGPVLGDLGRVRVLSLIIKRIGLLTETVQPKTHKLIDEIKKQGECLRCVNVL